ncbi:MAG: 2-C-methyl-D-erythritol 4-phosphate cytidylyltransferase [Verrucomicrobiota bacterium]
MSDHLSAVIVAAGKSQRMGFDKILTPITGTPLVVHTLQGILSSPLVKEVILVIRPEMKPQFEVAVRSLDTFVPVKYVDGGAERQDSVLAGVEASDSSSGYVMIHDAARPFVNAEVIQLVLDVAKECGAAVCGTPASDTLKEMGEGGQIQKTLDRSKIWAVQTPQIFKRDLILKAYQENRKSGTVVTDDTAAVEKIGNPVKVVPYTGINFKITSPADWALARTYLAVRCTKEAPGLMIRKNIHDINNQLTALFGYAYLLQSELEGNESVKNYLDQIDIAGKNCQELVAQIQSLSREIFPKENER